MPCMMRHCVCVVCMHIHACTCTHDQNTVTYLLLIVVQLVCFSKKLPEHVQPLIAVRQLERLLLLVRRQQHLEIQDLERGIALEEGRMEVVESQMRHAKRRPAVRFAIRCSMQMHSAERVVLQGLDKSVSSRNVCM
jgi:hypothetical protein